MQANESPAAEMTTAGSYERPQNRWKLKSTPDANAVENLAKQLNGNKIIATLLLQRNITNFEEAKKFFRPSLNDLHDPFLMKDMDKAVARIEKAIARNEKILVYGDYDVDGTTAVALFYTFLQSLNVPCGFYIPDRYAEGYGISLQGIDYAKENNYSLIVALDCGIKALDKISYAEEKGIDFIICDHHRPGDKLPGAVAVLDPKRSDCNYPFDELCGCGIGFKLAQAIAQKRNAGITSLEHLLDLVAVAIAADLVPVTGENRVLATFGLKRINENPRPGFKAMLELSKLKRSISISDVVFIFAPRINAAGRIEHGKIAVELLASLNGETAKAAAEAINKNNDDRRDLDKAITTHAMEMMMTSAVLQKKKSTVVYSEDWHKGVVGIVASRLIEKYYRPTIVLTKSNGKVTGSARSVKDFDVYEAIEACSDLLIQFGGHKYAAGLTMEESQVEKFAEKFEKEVGKRITDEQLIPEIEIDLEIAFEQIDWNFFNVLKQFAPFGPGNMSPVFLTKKIIDRGWARIVGEKHLKLDLVNPSRPDRIFPAIAFGFGDKHSIVANKSEVNVCYTIEENEYNGRVSLQLGIKDMKE
jgi:single-stranded-DNA-specific exonuclease